MSVLPLLKFEIRSVTSLINANVSDEGEVFTRSRGCPDILKKRKLYLGKVGYYVVTHTDHYKRQIPRYVHRMVAECFLPPQLPSQEVRHLDGNPLNNFVANLAWGTRQENVNDTIRHGRVAKGRSLPQTQLSELDVRVIRYLLGKGGKSYSIALIFKVARPTVDAIRDDNTWRHISHAAPQLDV